MKYILSVCFILLVSLLSINAQPAKKYGVVNLKGEVVLPIIYEEITPLENGYARTMRRERYGLIDSLGQEILECKYHQIQHISPNRAIVMMNKQYGVIDFSGNIIIPFDHKSIKPLANGFFLAYKSVTAGVYDNRGEVSVPFSNNMLIPFSGDRNYLISSNLIAKTNKIIDCRNNELTSFSNSNVRDFGNGYLGVKLDAKNTYRIYDINGREVNPTMTIENSQVFTGDYLRHTVRGKLGLLHISGKPILLPEYKRIFDFKNGYAKVLQDSTRFGDNQYGIVATNGKVVVRCMYDGLGELSDGRIMALAQQKYGYLDTNGRVIIPFDYDEASNFHDRIAIVSKDRRFGAIGINGKSVLPLAYDRLAYLGHSSFAAFNNSKWKIIGTDQQVKDSVEYDVVGNTIADKYIAVAVNRKWGLIDFSGVSVLPLIYKSVSGFGDLLFIVEM